MKKLSQLKIELIEDSKHNKYEFFKYCEQNNEESSSKPLLEPSVNKKK